jgi:hypothetical protein
MAKSSTQTRRTFLMNCTGLLALPFLGVPRLPAPHPTVLFSRYRADGPSIPCVGTNLGGSTAWFEDRADWIGTMRAR